MTKDRGQPLLGRRLWFALFGALLAAGCSTAPPPRPPVAEPPDNRAACLAGLDERHIVYERISMRSNPSGCMIDNPIKLSGALLPWERPGYLDCQTATVFYGFEAEVLQPLAQRFLGQQIKRLIGVGTYDCRLQTGGRTVLSQHGLGRAIDVHGFELADGTKLTVARDWAPRGPRREFLHAVAREACRYFKVVLGPNADKYHQDHLHLDTGPYYACRA
jgi:hypothetical protein